MLRRGIPLCLALAAVMILTSVQAYGQPPRRVPRRDRVPPAERPRDVRPPANPPAAPAEPVPATRPAVPAETDTANVHSGQFVRMMGDNKFVMRSSSGKEHTHVLARNAAVTENGRSVQLADLKKGESIRVTTREGDPTTAVRVEARTPARTRERTTTPPPAPPPPVRR